MGKVRCIDCEHLYLSRLHDSDAGLIVKVAYCEVHDVTVDPLIPRDCDDFKPCNETDCNTGTKR